jgi:BirA family biotin operon repressor/biotin-[acetyl-CoA-carboxylase] ligase
MVAMNAGALDIERIKAEVRTTRVGRRIEYLETTTSTNDEAWARIDNEDADGLVIFAEYQSAGRGRLGRTWHSPRGASLLCSVALITDEDDAPGDQLVLLTGVAAVDAIRACTDVTPTIKWPNDLCVAGRKLGGILIESRVCRTGRRACVVGIGLNCLHQRGHLDDELADSATSLEIESAQAVDRTNIAIALLEALDRWLARPRKWIERDLLDAWLARAEPMGRQVCLRNGGKVFTGSMIDLDPNAALVVRLDDGTVRAFDAVGTTVVQRPSTEVVGTDNAELA